MSLEEAIDNLRKRFGPDCIYRLGEAHEPVETISTGSLLLDRCIGGGWPLGRIVEVYGPEGGGKTTLALHGIVEAQKVGMDCAFIDTEHSLNVELAEKLGVKFKKVFFSQPDFGEQAIEVVLELLKNGVRFVVVDSVASLTPKSEIEGEMGDIQMGAHARLMGQALRKLVEPVSKANAVLLFLNQMRMKITSYGNPETTTGGNALKFYSSVRVDLRRRDILEKDKVAYGHLVEAKVVKNKVGPPYRKCQFNLIYGVGIDNVTSVIDLAVYDGVIVRKGAYYYYGEENLGCGLDAAKESLEKKPKMFSEIRKKLK